MRDGHDEGKSCARWRRRLSGLGVESSSRTVTSGGVGSVTGGCTWGGVDHRKDAPLNTTVRRDGTDTSSDAASPRGRSGARTAMMGALAAAMVGGAFPHPAVASGPGPQYSGVDPAASDLVQSACPAATRQRVTVFLVVNTTQLLFFIRLDMNV